MAQSGTEDSTPDTASSKPSSSAETNQSAQKEKPTKTCPSAKATEPKPFPLLSLPAELRVNIYRMALCRTTPLYLHLPRKKLTGCTAAGAHNSEGGCCPDSEDETPEILMGSVRVGRQTWTYLGDRRGCVKIDDDAIAPALLRTCSQVYGEARQVLYADNHFVMQLDTGVHTLGSLHQRSRSLIKHVTLTIPSHHDILDGFADLVRLGLRYCWGLKQFTIVLPSSFPDDRFNAGTTSVYANAFHILRWLPKECVVRLEGTVNEMIRRVVEDEGRLQALLDEKSYLRRQHQMPNRHFERTED